MIRGRKLKKPLVQVNRMEQRWPDLKLRVSPDERSIVWVGPIRGFQMMYTVCVAWDFICKTDPPFVFINSPKIKPRSGGDYEQIPHLQFNGDNPDDSALCLFDPEGREWNASMFIADTTIPWASEWLHHYECWHLDGVWRGANAPGPISVAEMRLEDRQGDIDRVGYL